MRLALAAALLIFAACSGDDGGDGPGVDGGGDPFVGDYSSTWSPAHSSVDIRVARVVVNASDSNERVFKFLETFPPGLETPCFPGECTALTLALVEGCVEREDIGFGGGVICPADGGLAGTVTYDNDGAPITHTVTMTRL